MSEIIASESTILAVITILFTIWQSRIDKALNIEIDRPLIDFKTEYEQFLHVKNFSVLPLALASSLNFLFLIPEVIKIFITSMEIILSFPISQFFRFYDIKSVIIIFIDISFLLLTFLFLEMYIRMIKIKKKILKIKKNN